MLQIEKLDTRKGSKYFIVESRGKEKITIASVSSLEKAGCLIRFLSGANIKESEYKLAVRTMQEIDREEAERLEAKKRSKNREKVTNEESEENVSGEANIGVFDGNTTD